MSIPPPPEPTTENIGTMPPVDIPAGAGPAVRIAVQAGAVLLLGALLLALGRRGPAAADDSDQGAADDQDAEATA